jgi:hypothetical protein
MPTAPALPAMGDSVSLSSTTPATIPTVATPSPRQGFESETLNLALVALMSIIAWQFLDHSDLNESSGLGKLRGGMRQFLNNLTAASPKKEKTVSLNEEDTPDSAIASSEEESSAITNTPHTEKVSPPKVGSPSKITDASKASNTSAGERILLKTTED